MEVLELVIGQREGRAGGDPGVDLATTRFGLALVRLLACLALAVKYLDLASPCSIFAWQAIQSFTLPGATLSGTIWLMCLCWWQMWQVKDWRGMGILPTALLPGWFSY
jgi:hypothetical protein